MVTPDKEIKITASKGRVEIIDGKCFTCKKLVNYTLFDEEVVIDGKIANASIDCRCGVRYLKTVANKKLIMAVLVKPEEFRE